ncbi:GGDEF domain-containing protein [Granulicella arctica]|uniref:GGDEF domain-containing protein n=1 Tax=Granulicella arctica TaxID=940613 RepID=UPI0021DFBA5E|nr:diguanylate cyclase [Granulicella arctica]
MTPLQPTTAEFDSSPTSDADPPARSLSLWRELLGTFLVMLLFSWLGIDLSRHSEGVATIWFSNGLLFAIIIRRPRAIWPWFFLIGLIADTLADVIYGDRFLLALGVSVANSIEVILASLLLTQWFGQPFKLSRLRPLVGFLIVAVVVGPLICSFLGTFWLMIFQTTGPWWQMVRTWYLGDCLGMAIVAPLVYILQRPGFFTVLQPKQLPKTLLSLAIPATATFVVFHHDHDPLIFAIYPALLFVVFRLGFPGAVLSVFVMACTAISLTVTGHGPLMLIPNSTMLHRIVVVQIFLAVGLFTSFPVAALLEQRQRLLASLEKSEARYRELANIDALTGQGNRRAFDERLNAEWLRSNATSQHLAILSIDVDLFKTYNDIYGHLAGDVCLRRIATSIADALLCCPSAKLFRLGGEEFAAVLPGVSAEEALSIADLIRRSVLSASIEHSGSPIGRQSVSIGVASTTPTTDVSVLTLLELSDQALYRAKRLGRNRVEAAETPPSEDNHPLPEYHLHS